MFASMHYRQFTSEKHSPAIRISPLVNSHGAGVQRRQYDRLTEYRTSGDRQLVKANRTTHQLAVPQLH